MLKGEHLGTLHHCLYRMLVSETKVQSRYYQHEQEGHSSDHYAIHGSPPGDDTQNRSANYSEKCLLPHDTSKFDLL